MATKQQEAPSVEETLNKTDLGQVIADNKRPIMILGAVVVLLIIAYSIMVQVSASKAAAELDRAFKKRVELFKPFLEGAEKDDAFKAKLLKMDSDYLASPNLTPDFFTALNKLADDKAMDKATLDFALKWIGKMNKKNNLYILSALRTTALLEDNDRADEAITLLQEMLSNKIEFLNDKVNFDLGRMLLAKGEKEKARPHFQAVVDAKDVSEFQTMAKIYLNE